MKKMIFGTAISFVILVWPLVAQQETQEKKTTGSQEKSGNGDAKKTEEGPKTVKIKLNDLEKKEALKYSKEELLKEMKRIENTLSRDGQLVLERIAQIEAIVIEQTKLKGRLEENLDRIHGDEKLIKAKNEIAAISQEKDMEKKKELFVAMIKKYEIGKNEIIASTRYKNAVKAIDRGGEVINKAKQQLQGGLGDVEPAGRMSFDDPLAAIEQLAQLKTKAVSKPNISENDKDSTLGLMKLLFGN
ncbi:MAG: hypothetical protein NTV55_01505 [Planctomycetota bacterium]|nr:hypothetical protein [Planctomycetota bacterium]